MTLRLAEFLVTISRLIYALGLVIVIIGAIPLLAGVGLRKIGDDLYNGAIGWMDGNPFTMSQKKALARGR